MNKADVQPEEMSACPMADKVDAFIANELSDRETAEFERHLADCMECLATIVEMRQVRNSFGTLSFLRRLQARPFITPLAANLLRALAVAGDRARQAGDAAATRLQTWRQRLADNLTTISDRVGRVAGSLEEATTISAEQLKDFGCVWLQLIGDSCKTATSPVRDSSSPKVPAEIKSPADGGVCFQVERVPGSNDIEVVARGLPSGAGRPVVLLIPAVAPESVRREILRQVSEKEWVARFEAVPVGEYMVAIEPLAG